MKFICSRKRRNSVLPIALLVLPLATGCGGGQPKGSVSGKVTYRNKPVSSGFVTFVPEKGSTLYSDIQSDGSYRMDNVPVGPVKIGIQSKSPFDVIRSSPMPRSPKDFDKVKETMNENAKQIPSQYGDPNKSGLTYTVTKGPQQYDIALK